MPAMSGFDYYGFVMKFEKPRSVKLPVFQDFSDYSESFVVPYKFFFSMSVKIITGIFTALNL